MFSDHFKAAWARLPEYANAETKPLDFIGEHTAGDFAPILWSDGFGSGGELDRCILERAANRKRSIFQDRLFAVVPVYVSSFCAEQCLYCNYRAGNDGVGVERKRLSLDELRNEASYLIDKKGFRALELVYGSDPQMKPSVIARQIELVQKLLDARGGGVVGLSCEAMDEHEYELLVGAGLSFSVLWMETYDPERYRELHPGKLRKSRFEYRLDAYERMVAAGVPAIGIGVLSGLSPWRSDWAMLMQHEEYLRRTYGRGAEILGIPRLKQAPGALMHGSQFVPTTEEFVTAVALHNLFSPGTAPFVSTREDWDTCIRLAQGGGCLFTLNCSTIPGGYSLEGKGSQFANNSFDVAIFGRKLAEMEFRIMQGWNLRELSASIVEAAVRE